MRFPVPILFTLVAIPLTVIAQDLPEGDPFDIDILEDHLYALGYMPGRTPAPPTSGVTLHDEARAHPGINLVLSPHQTAAYLTDMQGQVLHQWKHHLWDDWPEDRIPPNILAKKENQFDFWSRVHLYPNGDILFIHKGCGLFRLSRDSKIQWAAWMAAHHDVEVLPNGNILTLVRVDLHQPPPGNLAGSQDYLVQLDPSGKRIDRICIDTALANSNFAHIREGREQTYLHTNEILPLDDRHTQHLPAWRPGNYLLSCRNIDALIILDPAQQKVVWALTGPWRRQHGPALLDNGRLLLFDNRGNDTYSRVMEIDPLNGDIGWTYQGRPKSAFHTEVGGYAQRLPNGNTLITESNKGAAFEVTPQGDRVWEYLNPARLDRNNDRIAPLFLVHRYEVPPGFLQQPNDRN